MDTKIVKLNFISPLHLGAEGTGVEKIYDFLHSDTLFSAICHGWLEIYGRESLEVLLEEFPKNDQTTIPVEPPFIISSAFPFVVKGDETTYFLPKPQKRPPFPRFEGKKPKEAKRVEKTLDDMDWIDLELFWEWAKAVEPQEKWLNYKERFNKMTRLLDNAVNSDTRPRVTKDRRTSSSLLYHFGLIYFSDDEEKGRGGLYFLVRCRDESVENKLKAVLKLLGETGIGGERSSGYGRFEARWCELDERWKIPRPRFSNGRISLTLYYPSVSDLRRGKELPVYQYGLIKRAGWTSSPYQKKPYRHKVLNMFREGTTFATAKHPSIFRKDKTVGCLVDVASDEFLQNVKHPIYRYGIAFILPAQIRVRE